MKRWMILLLLVPLTTACVTGTRNVQLAAVDYQNDVTADGDIFIASITDDRVFEEGSGDPSVPSVNGDLDAFTAEQRAKLIGRQRNTWGKAMGEVALPDGGTVQEAVERLLNEGLQSRGYNVTSSDTGGARLSASTEAFWAWSTPGMFSVSFEAKIECKLTLTVDGQTQQYSVKGYGINKGQVASDANWALAIRRASEDFLANLDQVLDAAGH